MSLKRRTLLGENMKTMLATLEQSEHDVGLIVDVSDGFGRRIGIELMGKKKVKKLISTHRRRGEIPTLLIGLPWEKARQIMERTSPTAKENLKLIKPTIDKKNGIYLLVVLADQGNSYVVVNSNALPDDDDAKFLFVEPLPNVTNRADS